MDSPSCGQRSASIRFFIKIAYPPFSVKTSLAKSDKCTYLNNTIVLFVRCQLVI